MFTKLFRKAFGTKHDRQINRVRPLVERINGLEAGLKTLSDEQLRGKASEFRERLSRGETLDAMLPEVFAAVREAAWRAIGMRHYDVQLIGGIAMHQGKIVEMRTGEGKTLTATSALFLNALEGKGAHLVTVNDYLASRDAEWMGQVYRFLGMSCGAIVHGLSPFERQRSYRSDITYGTNNEFGFDYLRDNMKETIEKYVQRDLHYAIVDEVDSILIDEARTPLIISGESAKPAETYTTVDRVIPSLRRDLDYILDEKAKSVLLTDSGVDRVEQMLSCSNLYDEENSELLHHVNQALRANTIYKKDVQYLVERGEIVIVDEFTGRKMPGRRWSDGLHQAIEAKEGVPIQPESQTLATITYQNYFRMYRKLSGMTGTAETEAEEFHKIYNLDVMVIPTNRPITRDDADDLVYKNERGKLIAVVDSIRDAHERGQPVLVGTASVEKSQVIHQLLDNAKIQHNTLNAKNHAREAFIVAQAGRKHAVTVATNMAGRGTDIVLGGNSEMMAREQVDPEQDAEGFSAIHEQIKSQCDVEKEQILGLGGLLIVGTERHESRRIDNQLRGRSGRQGDPGRSQFYLSLEDDLMRIFGADRIMGLMERLGMEDDVPIEAPLVNRSIENAQEKVEAMHFDTRKNIFEYDNVMNEQRKAIYALRKQILEGRYAPEILDEEARKEQQDKLPPPPDTSGPHTVPTMIELVQPRVNAIVTAFCSAAAAEQTGAEPTEGGFPEGGIDARALGHELYRHYGALVDLESVREDRAKILEVSSDTVARSLIQQRERIHDLAFKSVEAIVADLCPEDVHPDDWDLEGLEESMKTRFYVEMDLSQVRDNLDKLVNDCWKVVEASLLAREEEQTLYVFLFYVRQIYLKEIDDQWIAHLKNIDALRTGIGLLSYATRNPKNEYKIRGFEMFSAMWSSIETSVLDQVVQMKLSEEQRQLAEEGAEYETELTKHSRQREAAARGRGAAAARGVQAGQVRAASQRAVDAIAKETGVRAEPGSNAAAAGGGASKGRGRSKPKVGRNDPCPCGSGKRYKSCHGKGESGRRRSGA